MGWFVWLIATLIAALVLLFSASDLAQGQEQTAAARVTESPQFYGSRPDLQALYGKEALERQYDFVSQMPAVNVRYDTMGRIEVLSGSTGIYLKDVIPRLKEGEPAPEILERIGPALMASGGEELRVRRIEEPPSQRKWPEARRFTEQIIQFNEYIGGLEVRSGFIQICVNERTGELTNFGGHFLPDRGLASKPVITAAEARQRVETKLRADPEAAEPSFPDIEPRLAYDLRPTDPGNSKWGGGELIWVIYVERTEVRCPVSLAIGVSALTGEVISSPSVGFCDTF